MSRTNRWYRFGRVRPDDPASPYDIVGWSRTKEAARDWANKVDPDCEPRAFYLSASDRDEARKSAVELFNVQVAGYISAEDRKFGKGLVKAMVVHVIFCPYTGVLLDMRRAVVVESQSSRVVCTGAHWDTIKDGVVSKLTEAGLPFAIYDGRELFKR